MKRRTLFAGLAALIGGVGAASVVKALPLIDGPSEPDGMVPVGTIFAHAAIDPNYHGNHAEWAPSVAVYRIKADGDVWLDCNGRVFETRSFPQLAAVLTSHVPGDRFDRGPFVKGQLFAVPNMNGFSGTWVGPHSHSMTTAAVPSHSHTFAADPMPAHSHPRYWDMATD